ncbi:uncharacterized protein LOC101860668 [Aplysia californica]|uniref:Uncharacterized protein LOC101860668 n=1 Tax=Aplysia californica TaxID=6500 RepID=A0ABM0JW24_APLCA|nr:uncharacterized protein LOC101860668 [Aplysia californica]
MSKDSILPSETQNDIGDIRSCRQLGEHYHDTNSERSSAESDPYPIWENSSFNEKMNRVKNSRAGLGQRTLPSNRGRKGGTGVAVSTASLATKEGRVTSKHKEQAHTATVPSLAAEQDSKHMQSLSNRLRESQKSFLTDSERREWYEKRGYTISANGLIVPRHQPVAKSENEESFIENYNEKEKASCDVLCSSPGGDKQRRKNCDCYLSSSDEGSGKGNFSDKDIPCIPNMKKFMNRRKRFIRSSPREQTTFKALGCPATNNEESGSSFLDNKDSGNRHLLISPDMFTRLYPARVALDFLSSDFHCGNELLDMECYGSYEDGENHVFEAATADEDIVDLHECGDVSGSNRYSQMGKSVNVDVQNDQVKSKKEIHSTTDDPKHEIKRTAAALSGQGDVINQANQAEGHESRYSGASLSDSSQSESSTEDEEEIPGDSDYVKEKTQEDTRHTGRLSPNSMVRTCYANLMCSMLRQNSVLLDNADMEVYRQSHSYECTEPDSEIDMVIPTEPKSIASSPSDNLQDMEPVIEVRLMKQKLTEPPSFSDKTQFETGVKIEKSTEEDSACSKQKMSRSVKTSDQEEFNVSSKDENKQEHRTGDKLPLVTKQYSNCHQTNQAGSTKVDKWGSNDSRVSGLIHGKDANEHDSMDATVQSLPSKSDEDVPGDLSLLITTESKDTENLGEVETDITTKIRVSPMGIGNSSGGGENRYSPLHSCRGQNSSNLEHRNNKPRVSNAKKENTKETPSRSTVKTPPKDMGSNVSKSSPSPRLPVYPMTISDHNLYCRQKHHYDYEVEVNSPLRQICKVSSNDSLNCSQIVTDSCQNPPKMSTEKPQEIHSRSNTTHLTADNSGRVSGETIKSDARLLREQQAITNGQIETSLALTQLYNKAASRAVTEILGSPPVPRPSIRQSPCTYHETSEVPLNCERRNNGQALTAEREHLEYSSDDNNSPTPIPLDDPPQYSTEHGQIIKSHNENNFRSCKESFEKELKNDRNGDCVQYKYESKDSENDSCSNGDNHNYSNCDRKSKNKYTDKTKSPHSCATPVWCDEKHEKETKEHRTHFDSNMGSIERKRVDVGESVNMPYIHGYKENIEEFNQQGDHTISSPHQSSCCLKKELIENSGSPAQERQLFSDQSLLRPNSDEQFLPLDTPLCTNQTVPDNTPNASKCGSACSLSESPDQRQQGTSDIAGVSPRESQSKSSEEGVAIGHLLELPSKQNQGKEEDSDHWDRIRAKFELFQERKNLQSYTNGGSFKTASRSLRQSINSRIETLNKMLVSTTRSERAGVVGNPRRTKQSTNMTKNLSSQSSSTSKIPYNSRQGSHHKGKDGFVLSSDAQGAQITEHVTEKDFTPNVPFDSCITVTKIPVRAKGRPSLQEAVQANAYSNKQQKDTSKKKYFSKGERQPLTCPEFQPRKRYSAEENTRTKFSSEESMNKSNNASGDSCTNNVRDTNLVPNDSFTQDIFLGSPRDLQLAVTSPKEDTGDTEGGASANNINQNSHKGDDVCVGLVKHGSSICSENDSPSIGTLQTDLKFECADICARCLETELHVSAMGVSPVLHCLFEQNANLKKSNLLVLNKTEGYPDGSCAPSHLFDVASTKMYNIQASTTSLTPEQILEVPVSVIKSEPPGGNYEHQRKEITSVLPRKLARFMDAKQPKQAGLCIMAKQTKNQDKMTIENTKTGARNLYENISGEFGFKKTSRKNYKTLVAEARAGIEQILSRNDSRSETSRAIKSDKTLPSQYSNISETTPRYGSDRSTQCVQTDYVKNKSAKYTTTAGQATTPTSRTSPQQLQQDSTSDSNKTPDETQYFKNLLTEKQVLQDENGNNSKGSGTSLAHSKCTGLRSHGNKSDLLSKAATPSPIGNGGQAEEKKIKPNKIRSLKETLKTAKNCRIPIRKFQSQSSTNPSTQCEYIQLNNIQSIVIASTVDRQNRRTRELAQISFKSCKMKNERLNNCLMTASNNINIVNTDGVLTLEISAQSDSVAAEGEGECASNRHKYKKTAVSGHHSPQTESKSKQHSKLPCVSFGKGSKVLSQGVASNTKIPRCQTAKKSRETMKKDIKECKKCESEAESGGREHYGAKEILHKTTVSSNKENTVSSDKIADQTKDNVKKIAYARQSVPITASAKLPCKQGLGRSPAKEKDALVGLVTSTAVKLPASEKGSRLETDCSTKTESLLARCELFSASTPSEGHRFSEAESLQEYVELEDCLVKYQRDPCESCFSQKEVYQSCESRISHSPVRVDDQTQQVEDNVNQKKIIIPVHASAGSEFPTCQNQADNCEVRVREESRKEDSQTERKPAVISVVSDNDISQDLANRHSVQSSQATQDEAFEPGTSTSTFSPGEELSRTDHLKFPIDQVVSVHTTANVCFESQTYNTSKISTDEFSGGSGLDETQEDIPSSLPNVTQVGSCGSVGSSSSSLPDQQFLDLIHKRAISKSNGELTDPESIHEDDDHRRILSNCRFGFVPSDAHKNHESKIPLKREKKTCLKSCLKSTYSLEEFPKHSQELDDDNVCLLNSTDKQPERHYMGECAKSTEEGTDYKKNETCLRNTLSGKAFKNFEKDGYSEIESMHDFGEHSNALENMENAESRVDDVMVAAPETNEENIMALKTNITVNSLGIKLCHRACDQDNNMTLPPTTGVVAECHSHFCPKMSAVSPNIPETLPDKRKPPTKLAEKFTLTSDESSDSFAVLEVHEDVKKTVNNDHVTTPVTQINDHSVIDQQPSASAVSERAATGVEHQKGNSPALSTQHNTNKRECIPSQSSNHSSMETPSSSNGLRDEKNPGATSPSTPKAVIYSSAEIPELGEKLFRRTPGPRRLTNNPQKGRLTMTLINRGASARHQTPTNSQKQGTLAGTKGRMITALPATESAEQQHSDCYAPESLKEESACMENGNISTEVRDRCYVEHNFKSISYSTSDDEGTNQILSSRSQNKVDTYTNSSDENKKISRDVASSESNHTRNSNIGSSPKTIYDETPTRKPPNEHDCINNSTHKVATTPAFAQDKTQNNRHKIGSKSRIPLVKVKDARLSTTKAENVNKTESLPPLSKRQNGLPHKPKMKRHY